MPSGKKIKNADKFRSGIIGAGQLAAALYQPLCKIYSLEWILVRNSKRDSLFEGAQIIREINKISNPPNIIILAIGDNEIEEVSLKLSNLFKNKLKGIKIIHCSGILPASILDDCAKFGAVTAKVHPYQTLYSARENILEGAGWGIEADNDKDYFAEFVEALGGKPVFLKPNTDALYHGSAVVASNFMNSLLSLAKEMATMAGIKPEDFQTRIIEETITNNYSEGMDFPLTGPIARADISGIEKHIEALKSRPSALKTYCYLALATTETAKEKGFLSPVQYDKLKLILKKYI